MDHRFNLDFDRIFPAPSNPRIEKLIDDLASVEAVKIESEASAAAVGPTLGNVSDTRISAHEGEKNV
jgi:hypothetical protein